MALQRYPPREGDELPVIKIAELRAGTSVGADRCGGVPPEYVIDDGDVVFSWSGSLMVDIWCGGKGALNQHLFKVTSNNVPKWFYLGWLNEHLQEFQAIAADKATTMGHIRRFHLTEAKVLLPPDPLMKAMTSVQHHGVPQIVEPQQSLSDRMCSDLSPRPTSSIDVCGHSGGSRSARPIFPIRPAQPSRPMTWKECRGLRAVREHAAAAWSNSRPSPHQRAIASCLSLFQHPATRA
ncbi:MAG TPA: hypothetical protein VHI98_04150 [Vicinamibacterales bacterium]|nr:hypothetical protein [Vicinamibacterales bacterium]